MVIPVIETNIPIVKVPQHHEAQSSSHSERRNYFDCVFGGVPNGTVVRAIALYDNSDCHYTEDDAIDIRRSNMPEQLRDVMTHDVYIEFCTKMNDWIRQHDIAAQQRHKYNDTNFNIWYIVILVCIFTAIVLAVKFLMRSSSSSWINTVRTLYPYCIFWVFICRVGYKCLYYRTYNEDILKYIT